MKYKDDILLLTTLAMPFIIVYGVAYYMGLMKVILPYLTVSISGYNSIDLIGTVLILPFVGVIVQVLPKNNIGGMLLYFVCCLVLLALSMRIVGLLFLI